MKKFTTQQLKAAVVELSEKFDEESSIAFELALNELEKRMTEEDFVLFCDGI